MLSRLVAPVLLVAVIGACSASTYTVGGTVTGLQGSGLVLQNDGTNNITITKDGPFTLPGTLTAKSLYFVTVLTQPSSPAQTCTVTSAAGAIVAANVTNVAVSCSTGTYPVGGTVSGLAGSGLVLQDNGGDSLAVAANGSFSFATSLANEAAYAVTVSAQPTTPTQTCAVTGGTGTVGSSPVTSVAVACTTTTFTIGGSITGLLGTGLVLEDNGGDDLTITSGETFAFATPVASGTPYSVTIKTQPTGPSQACTVSGGAGTVGSGNVTSITVNCSTTTVTVGGVVTGLTGSGLVLENNGGDMLKVTSNGLFAFPTAVASGAAYAVTVSTQPASPTQTCTVAGGTGMVAGASVTSVVVTCATNTYALSGTVTGLKGTGLVLQDNGGDNVTVTPSMTTFTFPTSLASGATYAIAVSTQPTGPSQTCVVSTDPSGTIGSAAITDITVTCTTDTYAIGGVVTGLVGTGLVLEDNGGDNLKVTADGPFAFANPVASGGMFDVTVETQPSTPSQTCVVTGGSGEVAGSAVGTVTVNCSTNEYAVSGTVSGLVGAGLALSLNGGAGIQVGMNGKFSFPTTLLKGATYSVAIATQPSSPAQTCTLTGATGTIAAANVSSVDVSCSTNTYPITVSVTGLAGTGLTLQDNGGDNLAVPSSGSYTFMTLVASGASYAVAVSTQPSSPTQTCSVANGAGTVAGGAVSNVTVSCSTNTYGVGGTIMGLAGTVVLQDNSSDTLIATAVSASSAPISFTFAAPVPSGSPYAVTVSQQPGSPSQTCNVSNGTGTMGTAAVTGVTIACTTNTYGLSATVVGLVGSGLVIADNAGDSVTVTQNGVVTLPTPYASGTGYTVSVGAQPTSPAQTCAVLGGTGTVGTSNVTGITVNCATNLYTISGSVAGLLGSGLVLADNAGDSLPVSGNGTFSMPTSYASSAVYSLTVLSQPTSPSQTCTAATGTASGTVGTSNITNVNFTCVITTYTVSVNVNGLIGGGLELADNASDTLTLTQNGLSTFAVPVASQKTYAVTVLNQPTSPSQTCSVATGSGTIVGSNVTLAVNCTTNTYAVSVAVTGLVGTGLKFWNNGGNGLLVTANGTFPFTTLIPSGGVYDVTVLTQPSTPAQACTVTSPSGTIAGAPVTVAVACVTSSFTVGGTIAGLAGGSVVLQNSASTNTVTVASDGTFQFPALASGSVYAVTVNAQPTSPSETCTVANGIGTVAAAAVTNIAVTCSLNTYAVSVAVTGLAGTGLKFWNNGGNGLSVTANGTFPFTTLIPSGGVYDVTVLTQPSAPSQVCTVTSPSGTVAGGAVTLSVACVTSSFAVGGTISGLASGSVILQNNTASTTLTVSANGVFQFPTAVASGGAYAVTVQTQPSSPTQSCTVSNGSGTVAGAAVTNVAVTCATSTFTVGGTITGYTGSGLQLLLNGASALSLTSGSTSFSFGTSIPSGGTYIVAVATQPLTPTQSCAIAAGSGTVTSANVTSIAIACTTSTFTIGGGITGLTMSGLVLALNGANNLTVASGATSFAFGAGVASGSTYAVTVATQPTGQSSCTVANGSGTVTNGNVGNVIVNCNLVQCTKVISSTLNETNPTGVAVAVSFTMIGGGGGSGGGSGGWANGGGGGSSAILAGGTLVNYAAGGYGGYCSGTLEVGGPGQVVSGSFTLAVGANLTAYVGGGGGGGGWDWGGGGGSGFFGGGGGECTGTNSPGGTNVGGAATGGGTAGASLVGGNGGPATMAGSGGSGATGGAGGSVWDGGGGGGGFGGGGGGGGYGPSENNTTNLSSAGGSSGATAATVNTVPGGLGANTWLAATTLPAAAGAGGSTDPNQGGNAGLIILTYEAPSCSL